MQTPSSFAKVIDCDGLVFYDREFFGREASDLCLAHLMSEVPWSQDSIKIFGRIVLQPRLTCWMGDPGAVYKYSGLLMEPKPWSPTVLTIKNQVESALDVAFNSALLNFYRDGSDSMGWHRDNEKELGPQPIIASASFGCERIFEFRRYRVKGEKVRLKLASGSLLVMTGKLQEFWEHSIPKAGKLTERGPRVNITFRNVILK